MSVKHSLFAALCFLFACKADKEPDQFLEIDLIDDYIARVPICDQNNFVEEKGDFFPDFVYYDSVADLRLLIDLKLQSNVIYDTSDLNNFDSNFYFQKWGCNNLKQKVGTRLQYNLGGSENLLRGYLFYDLRPGNILNDKIFELYYQNDYLSVSFHFVTPTERFDLPEDWKWANRLMKIEVLKKSEADNL